MIITNKQRIASRWIMAGSVSAALAIVLGAFGSHALGEALNAEQSGWFETAVRYQMTHAIALVLTGLLASASNTGKWLRPAGYCFIAGIVFFSGSLYCLTATQIRIFGAVTPVGGVLLIAGWLFLALAARDMNKGHPL